MIRPAAIVIGLGLTLLAGKAANIVAGAGLNPRASSVGVPPLLPARATTRDGGFSLSSSPASATVDAGCFNDPWVSNAPVLLTSGPVPWSPPNREITGDQPEHGGPAAEAVGSLSVGAVGSADPRPDAGASAYMDARSRTDGPTPSAPDRLLSAIEFVESRGRADAVGDGGRAVGVLQIWPITVADANRILGRDEFTLADRLDPDRSRQIFYVITNHYSAGCSDEVKARRWNSGPTGDQKACSLDYWLRVQNAMEEQR